LTPAAGTAVDRTILTPLNWTDEDLLFIHLCISCLFLNLLHLINCS
jgi:hypothetical protein